MKPTEKTSKNWRDILKNAKEDGVVKTLWGIVKMIYHAELKTLKRILIGLGTLTLLFITYKIYYKAGSLNSVLNTVGSGLVYGILAVVAAIGLGVIALGYYIYSQAKPEKKAKPTKKEEPAAKVEEPGTAPSSDKDEEAENPDASPSGTITKKKPEDNKSPKTSSGLEDKLSDVFGMLKDFKIWIGIFIFAGIILAGKGCGSGCNGFESSKKSPTTEAVTIEQLTRTKDSLEKVAIQKLQADSLNQSIAYLNKFNKTMDSIISQKDPDRQEENQGSSESTTTQKSSGSGSWRNFFSFSGLFSQWKGTTASTPEERGSQNRQSTQPLTSPNQNVSSSSQDRDYISGSTKEEVGWLKNNQYQDTIPWKIGAAGWKDESFKNNFEQTRIQKQKNSRVTLYTDPSTGRLFFYNKDGEPEWVDTHNQSTEEDDALRILEDVNSTKEQFDKALGKISH
jgi:hypothetical protein